MGKNSARLQDPVLIGHMPHTRVTPKISISRKRINMKKYSILMAALLAMTAVAACEKKAEAPATAPAPAAPATAPAAPATDAAKPADAAAPTAPAGTAAPAAPEKK